MECSVETHLAIASCFLAFLLYPKLLLFIASADPITIRAAQEQEDQIGWLNFLLLWTFEQQAVIGVTYSPFILEKATPQVNHSDNLPSSPICLTWTLERNIPPRRCMLMANIPHNLLLIPPATSWMDQLQTTPMAKDQSYTNSAPKKHKMLLYLTPQQHLTSNPINCSSHPSHANYQMELNAACHWATFDKTFNQFTQPMGSKQWYRKNPHANLYQFHTALRQGTKITMVAYQCISEPQGI